MQQLVFKFVKFVNWREICRQTAFPRGRHRGHTALRRVFLACRKAIAAIFLQALESSFPFHVMVVSFPVLEATG
jgi:hypothetical protein